MRAQRSLRDCSGSSWAPAGLFNRVIGPQGFVSGLPASASIGPAGLLIDSFQHKKGPMSYCLLLCGLVWLSTCTIIKVSISKYLKMHLPIWALIGPY
jgi:hypothetical protein